MLQQFIIANYIISITLGPYKHKWMEVKMVSHYNAQSYH